MTHKIIPSNYSLEEFIKELNISIDLKNQLETLIEEKIYEIEDKYEGSLDYDSLYSDYENLEEQNGYVQTLIDKIHDLVKHNNFRYKETKELVFKINKAIDDSYFEY